MVLVAAVPLAIADHEVVKGAQGPRASAVTWEYQPLSLGKWWGNISNNGLRSLVVNVYDNTTGAMDQVMHQRIRFAAYDAFPVGMVDTWTLVMQPGKTYVITVIPNGPRGSNCTVVDMYKEASPPTAAFSATVDHMDVLVDASASDDLDGTIDSYDWSFGDGMVMSGTTPTATHTYAMPGSYLITLLVTDNEGLVDTAEETVTIVDELPVAMFTWSVDGRTVSVDAALSSDDYGIISYAWDFGDGTTDSGMTASHTYAQMGIAPSVDRARQPPPMPYPVFGYVYDTDGMTPLDDAAVHITDSLSGLSYDVVTAMGGYWQIDIGATGFYEGTTINATATYGTTLIGWNEGTAYAAVGYLWLDIVMTKRVVEVDTYTVTLTVTDTIGQTASMSAIVEVPRL